MTKDKILEGLREILIETGKIEKDYTWPDNWESINLKDKYKGGLNLDYIELVMALEAKFFGEKDINDDDAEKFITIGDIVSYIDERLKKPGGKK